ncbi:hypothetical protein SLA2020_526900 [Shorea laevis]
MERTYESCQEKSGKAEADADGKPESEKCGVFPSETKERIVEDIDFEVIIATEKRFVRGRRRRAERKESMSVAPSVPSQPPSFHCYRLAVSDCKKTF